MLRERLERGRGRQQRFLGNLRLWGEDFLRDMEALDRADRAAQR